MEQHTLIHGFSVLREQEVAELDAVLIQMRHEKTGLELVWLKRAEENKTFGIAFRTIPEDNTGVFHILEHSVLCGSERYPVKDPFVELMKYSMNTFLNAMTFPDKTVYPVSSRNDKDFLNLMRVYLDAVFHPLIYARPEIFQQEGWHYELDGQGQASYKGVVFNEMKGVFADVDELSNLAANRALFPDTCYRFESGGDPACIPDLTYEQFLASHRTCYVPSNGYVFLDGAVDIEAVLSILDGEYLSGFGPAPRPALPALQRPVKAAPRRVEYELSPEEEPQGRFRLVWGNVIGTFDQREKLTAMQVLSSVLCGDNQAPLCRAILSQGLAETVEMTIMDEVDQPWVKLEVRNLAEENQERVEQVLFGELERLAREGLDRARLEAALANLEFRMRERDYGYYPQGLIFSFHVLDSWMRGGDPAANLEVGGLFDTLRARARQGWFEQLIRQVLLDNPHSCRVLLVPSHTAGEARRQAEADRLARESSRWSPADRAALQERQKALAGWQAAGDPPEALAKLPHLGLSDIRETPEDYPTEQAQAAGVPVLRHRIPCSGVVYPTLYFDVTGCTGEELSCLSFLCELLGRVDTEAHTAEALGNRVRLLCGTLQFYLSAYETYGQPDRYTVKLCAGLSTLEANGEPALELVAELLTQSKFDQEQAVQDLLRQAKTRMFQQIVLSGSSVALGRVAAQRSAAAAAEEYAGGLAYYQWLKAQDTQWNWPRLRRQLEELYRQVFTRARLTLSLTGTPTDGLAGPLERLLERLPAQPARPLSTQGVQPLGRRREGVEIPADISFAAMGGSLADAGGAYSGKWRLVSRIVGLDYLWNAIRVQGGAYGTGLTLRDSGFAACYSYRDPNPARSLDCYPKTEDFLRQFCGQERDLTGFIIGAISDGEPLLTPRTKGLTADGFYWKQISWEQRCALRRELLGAHPGQLAPLAGQLGQVLRRGGVCVLGPRERLDACGLETITAI